MKEFEKLIDVDDTGWSICRAHATARGEPQHHTQVYVYAEHEACSHDDGSRTIELNKDEASWSWEYNDEHKQCWVCKKPVPDRVVGLVLLYNFDRVC